jgi:hypothetical protein
LPANRAALRFTAAIHPPVFFAHRETLRRCHKTIRARPEKLTQLPWRLPETHLTYRPDHPAVGLPAQVFQTGSAFCTQKPGVFSVGQSRERPASLFPCSLLVLARQTKPSA